MAEWGNLIIIMFMVYYTYKIINIFRTGTKNLKAVNNYLDKYRNKKVLSLKEQKEFIDVKFGKKTNIKHKFSWRTVWHIVSTLLIFIALFMFYNYLITILDWIVPLWVAIACIMILPIIFSIFFKMMGMGDNNVLVDLFWRTKR